VQLPKYGGIRPTLVPVGVDQDPHIRLSRDVAQAHRLFNVMETKDHRIGVFVKIDTDVRILLDMVERVAHDLGFTKLQRITEYKALYLNDATVEDIPRINEALAKKEPEFGGYGFLQPCSTYHRFMTGLTGDKMSSSKPESAIFLTDSPNEAQKKIMHAKTGGAASLEEQRKQGGSPDTCVVYELFLYHLIENDEELATIYQSCRQGSLMCGQCKKQAAELMTNVLVDLTKKRAQAHEKIRDYISDI
jgi:tryptophanyl-tRNA synthetase